MSPVSSHDVLTNKEFCESCQLHPYPVPVGFHQYIEGPFEAREAQMLGPAPVTWIRIAKVSSFAAYTVQPGFTHVSSISSPGHSKGSAQLKHR